MTAGERIKAARKKNNLTQKALGEKCNMPDSQIRQYELGMVTPKLDTLRRIATALNIPISDLINDWNDYSYDELKKDSIRNTVQLDELTECVRKGRINTINSFLDLMNDEGQEKAVEQVEMLTKIPEFQKENPHQ